MASRRTSTAVSGNPAGSFELYDERMPVRRYKLLLQTFLKRRGPGTRQAIAEALGNTRSFITQITSPAYSLAISPQQVRTIVRLVGLQPHEERTFLDAYVAAHPERAAAVFGRSAIDGPGRTITLSVPSLSSHRAQLRLETLIERFARELAVAMLETEAECEPRIGKDAA